MAKLIFFALYPTDKNLQDGFYVRVKNIDDVFDSEQRLYLSVSFTKNFKSKTININDKLTLIQVNVFCHYFKILKLLKTSNIYYVQSLYNYLWTIFFSFGRGKRVIWDVHGVVPEEEAFRKKKVKSYLYGLLESSLAHRANLVVTVTNSMCNYLTEKYPKITKSNILFPIINKFLLGEPSAEQINLLRKELGIVPTNIVFIYSGSLIKWQRFEDVLTIIKKLKNANYRFVVLTVQIEEAKNLIAAYNLTNKIIVKKVPQNELSNYYSLSHYGFILRDKHTLNHVAAPTKLLEYMYYGIMPIVDYEEIGDFFDLGYDHVSFCDVLDDMHQNKSSKNKDIINSILENNQKKYLRDAVLS